MSSSSVRRSPCLRPTHWTRRDSQPARSATAPQARSNSSARASTAAALTLRLRGRGAALAGLALERLLRQLRDARETLRIGDGHVGQHLAVEQRAGGLEPGDQAAVGEAAQMGGGVDAHDPQAAKLPLLLPAVAVGVAQRLVHRELGHAVAPRLHAIEAAGAIQNFLALLQALVSTLDTCHLWNLVSAPAPRRGERSGPARRSSAIRAVAGGRGSGGQVRPSGKPCW